jgi:ABC-type uncharacterized transport system permease subunit
MFRRLLRHPQEELYPKLKTLFENMIKFSLRMAQLIIIYVFFVYVLFVVILKPVIDGGDKNVHKTEVEILKGLNQLSDITIVGEYY